jgi:hypothetical protein
MKKQIYLATFCIFIEIIQASPAQAGYGIISKSGSSTGPVKAKNRDYWWNIDYTYPDGPETDGAGKVGLKLKASAKKKVDGQKLSEYINANNNWFVPRSTSSKGYRNHPLLNKAGLATLSCSDSDGLVKCTFDVDENKNPIYK